MTRLYRPLLVAGMVHIAALVPVLAAMSVDDRLILGINPWIKPAKFLLSVGVYVALQHHDARRRRDLPGHGRHDHDQHRPRATALIWALAFAGLTWLAIAGKPITG